MSINSKSTKAELWAHIARQDDQLIAHGRAMERLRLELSIARSAPRQTVQRTLPAHMAAAKALAVKLGKPVRVGDAS